MPRGDRSGPMGQGSGTGRGAGFCSGTDAPGFSSAPGRGGRQMDMGMGRGRMGGRGGVWCRGMGRGAGFAPGNVAGSDTDAERQALLQQAQAMQANLDALNERLARLEKTTEE
ncbi:MAG: DUF5320 domain-containing protein [Desulfovibrio sp.]